MINDLTFGFISATARTKANAMLTRKVTLPEHLTLSCSHTLTGQLELSGNQCHPLCCYPLYSLLMYIHNHLATREVTANESVISLRIKKHEWLYRSRLVYSDYHNLRNSERQMMIGVNNLEELLSCLSTTICHYTPYAKKEYNFGFLSCYSYSRSAECYTLSIPVMLLPVLDLLGALIQEYMTELLLTRRQYLLPVFNYLRQSLHQTYKVNDILADLYLEKGKVRIMSVLSQLAEHGVLSFVCYGKGEARVISELRFTLYGQRILEDEKSAILLGDLFQNAG